MTIWLNSHIEPEVDKRGFHGTNSGKVIHLGGIGSLRNRTSEPINVHDIRLNDGDPERQAAHVYNSPIRINILANNDTRVELSDKDLPLCTSGEARGRWRIDLTCAVYKSNNNKNSNISLIIPKGHRCAQTDIAYQGDGYPAPVSSKIPNLIWTPTDCQLRDFYGDIVEANGTISGTKIITYSKASHCLSTAHIGVITGFGDSLGNELRDSLVELIGGRSWPLHTNNRTSSPVASGWIECDVFRVPLHWMSEFKMLIQCLNYQIEKLLRIKRISPDTNTVVLVTNFMIQHAAWKLTLNETEYYMSRQQDIYSNLRTTVAKKGIHLRLIWYSGVYIHGFKRVPGLTPTRQLWINNKAKDILRDRGGWEVLDAYAMTEARPDGTFDGVHYRGGVANAIAMVLLNMLCNSRP